MNNILPWVNAIACGLIALRLMTFSRKGEQHRPLIAVVAYLIVVATASVPIRFFFGDYPIHDISETFLNVTLCVAVFAVKGNIARMFRGNANNE